MANLYVRPPTPQILDFGRRFWILGILDFGFWILGILDFGSWGFWILDFGAEIQNPQSKIQNPNFFGRFWGFWILDFGPLCSKSLCEAPKRPKFGGFWILGILDFGFWILDLGILDFGFWILGILDFGFWGFWILDFGGFGFWILDFGDFGFWILDRYVANLYVRPPTPQIWGILDFGDFGDFGFWILDFGDFGFWILEFGDSGFWILDFVTNFGFYIRRRRLCTPTRVGGLHTSKASCHLFYGTRDFFGPCTHDLTSFSNGGISSDDCEAAVFRLSTCILCMGRPRGSTNARVE